MPQITYNLPPYVKTVKNPHASVIAPIDSNLTSNDKIPNPYADYKLKSLGNYPMGVYSVNFPVPTPYSGDFEAISTTNTSITLLYPNNITQSYPSKTENTYMDVNCYSFAGNQYPYAGWAGGKIPFEKYHDPLVYDYDAYEWTNSISFVQHHIANRIYFKGKVENLYIYGYSTIFLPELIYNTRIDNVPDPTNLSLIPNSDRRAIRGRYFVFVKKMLDSNEIQYEFLPKLPSDKNIEIWISNLNNEEKFISNTTDSGIILNILYDGFYWSKTGPGYSIVLPAVKNKKNNTQPALISLPLGSDYGAFRFFSGRRRKKDFDLYRSIPNIQNVDVINNAIPGNILSKI